MARVEDELLARGMGWIEQRPGDGWTGMDPKEEDRGGGGAEESEGGMGEWWLVVGDPDGD